MKRLHWLLIGLMVLGLGMVLLAGCVSKSDYEALQAEYAALVAEKESVKADYDNLSTEHEALQAEKIALEAELAEIKEVYPPRDFPSLSELEDWLRVNDVSERPTVEFAEGWYRKALEIQEDALKDGYIVSADYDYYEEEDLVSVFCVTIINGDLWYWDPETDEPYQDYSLGKVK